MRSRFLNALQYRLNIPPATLIPLSNYSELRSNLGIKHSCTLDTGESLYLMFYALLLHKLNNQQLYDVGEQLLLSCRVSWQSIEAIE